MTPEIGGGETGSDQGLGIRDCLVVLDEGPFESESRSKSLVPDGKDLSSVFADDFLADGEAESRAARALGRFEDIEQFGDHLFRDSRPVVGDRDDEAMLFAVESGLDENPGIFGFKEGIDGVGDEIEDGR